MEQIKPTLKFVTKKDFISARANYGKVSNKANVVIEKADNLDVLVLAVKMGSALEVMDAKVINEGTEDTFVEILKEGF